MEHPQEREAPTVITSDTENATTIQPEEAAPDKQEKFRRLKAYNTGMWNGPRRENTEQFRRQDNLHRYDSISSSLDLFRHQKKRGRKILDSLDVKSVGRPVDDIIFAICTLVANADVRDGTRYWPAPTTQNNDSTFREIGQELGLTQSEQMSIIERVRSKVNL